MILALIVCLGIVAVGMILKGLLGK